jgi:REP element-mobilizing transposase RayT
MGRPLRHIPEGGSLVEVTNRTIQGRFLLRPGEELNRTVKGVLARAARLHEVQVMGGVYLSNHYHLLVWVEHAKQLADFMGYLNGNLAREAGRLHGWRDKFWARRYQAALVSEEEEAQVARLKYLLSHGAKEHLVRRPQDWPGVHCVEALLTGAPLEGVWVNRSRQCAERRKCKAPDPNSYAEVESLSLAPLPCWKHLSEAQYRERIRTLLTDIEREVEEVRERGNISLPARRVCRRRILRQDPQKAPKKMKKSPAPRVHAFRKSVRKAMHEAYGHFYAAYRQAAERLKEGERQVSFPPGSFPPALPFVLPAVARAP